jgi:hypothetical protein
MVDHGPGGIAIAYEHAAAVAPFVLRHDRVGQPQLARVVERAAEASQQRLGWRAVHGDDGVSDRQRAASVVERTAIFGRAVGVQLQLAGDSGAHR